MEVGKKMFLKIFKIYYEKLNQMLMKLLKRKGFKRKLFNSCDFFFKIQ